jgi:hypothetical protein
MFNNIFPANFINLVDTKPINYGFSLFKVCIGLH